MLDQHRFGRAQVGGGFGGPGPRFFDRGGNRLIRGVRFFRFGCRDGLCRSRPLRFNGKITAGGCIFRLGRGGGLLRGVDARIVCGGSRHCSLIRSRGVSAGGSRQRSVCGTGPRRRLRRNRSGHGLSFADFLFTLGGEDFVVADFDGLRGPVDEHFAFQNRVAADHQRHGSGDGLPGFAHVVESRNHRRQCAAERDEVYDQFAGCLPDLAERDRQHRKLIVRIGGKLPHRLVRSTGLVREVLQLVLEVAPALVQKLQRRPLTAQVREDAKQRLLRILRLVAKFLHHIGEAFGAERIQPQLDSERARRLHRPFRRLDELRKHVVEVGDRVPGLHGLGQARDRRAHFVERQPGGGRSRDHLAEPGGKLFAGGFAVFDDAEK